MRAVGKFFVIPFRVPIDNPQPMARWKRTAKEHLIKTREMTDGELLHLLVGADCATVTNLDVEIYASLQSVRSGTIRILLWCIASSAFGVLSYFGMLKTVNAGGLELAPQVFKHAALFGISATGAAFCLGYSKLTFLQSWFSRKFALGSARERAELLLRFPDAYWYFSYLPGVIGYPKHIFARRSSLVQLASLVLVILILVGIVVASFWLWIALAMEVLISTPLGHMVSWLTFGISMALVLLGWLAPFRYDFSRKYTHYGMVNLLSQLSAEKSHRAHLRIIRVARSVTWSKRKELVRTAALSLASVAVISLLIWALSQQSLRYERDAADRSAKHAGYAEREISRRCFLVPEANYSQCVNEGQDAAREYQRKEQDLAAQKSMAWWTAVMGAAAVSGMALSILGVYLVWSTFRETRKANVIARESAEAQMRAWLTIEATEIIGFRMVNEQPTFHVRMTIKNVGNSPALAVSYFMSMAFGDNAKEHLDETVEFYRASKIDWMEGSLFPGEELVKRVSCEHTGERQQVTKVGFYLVATYRTALSDELRITAHLSDIIDSRRDDGMIDFNSLPFGEHLRLRPNSEFPGYAS